MNFTNGKIPKYHKKTPSTSAQTLAQKENFAIFQIKSMCANLTHLKLCATVPQSSVLSVENTLKAIEKKIKLEQAKRKQLKQSKEYKDG